MKILACCQCDEKFEVSNSGAAWRKYQLKKNNAKWYCCEACRLLSRNNHPKVDCVCKQCGKEFKKYYQQCIKCPNHFCTQSCAATYNNTHKTKGTRRSKLEAYMEEQLIKIFPSINFHFNKKDAINSELDIFLPDLKLAFELNGIFHYEPIFGENQLSKIQNNDQRKFQACLERGIELCIIDTSKLVYHKESTAKPYLDIVVNIIKQRVGGNH